MQIFFAYCAHLQAYLLNSLQNYYIRLTLEVSRASKMHFFLILSINDTIRDEMEELTIGRKAPVYRRAVCQICL